MSKINLGRVTGKSAYEVAVDTGFTGTQAEWLDSLKPETDQTYSATSENAQSGNAVSEAISTVMDTAPFNAATGNTYADFVEKYQLKQNKWVDLSFVGNPKYYSSFTTAVSDINAGIRTNGADVVANAAAVTFVANGITVLRLLKDIELTATLAFTESVILDLYEYNLTYTGTMEYCLSTNTTMAFILYSNHKTFGGSVGTMSAVFAQGTYCGVFNTTIKVIQTTYDLTTSALRIKNSKFDVYNCNLSVVDTSPNKSTNCIDMGLNSNTSSGTIYNTHISVDGMVHVSGLYVVEHNVAQKIYFLNNSIDVITHSTTATTCYGIVSVWASTDKTNPSTLVIDNCDIRAYSNDYGDNSAVGVINGFIAYMSNSCCTGVTSGVQNNQTIHMYKCTCASPYHGGFYNASNGTAYLTDTVFSRSACPTGYSPTAAGSAYFGYGSRAFLDGCTFINIYPVLRGADNPVGEHTEASFSNCEFYNNQIRVDDEQIAFVGEGCPTLTNIRTPNPGTITVTTATYRYDTPNIQTSDGVITANQLLTANVINDIADGQYVKIDSIDQTYNSTSTNAQSGKAVAEVLQNQYQNNLTTPATLADSNGGILSNIAIIGSSYQNGTPTPTTPIEIQDTGNTLTLKSGASTADTNATTYTIPLTDINGTSHTMRQFDEVKKHSDGKWYFDCNSMVKELNGTESWVYENAYFNYVLSTKSNPVNRNQFLSTKYKNTVGQNLSFRTDSSGTWLGIMDSNYTTVDAWKAQLATWNTAGNPLTILYQKETTTSYELSAETSAILDNIAIQKGDANICFTNTVAPIMTADYPLDMKLYVDNKMSALAARLTALENTQ